MDGPGKSGKRNIQRSIRCGKHLNKNAIDFTEVLVSFGLSLEISNICHMYCRQITSFGTEMKSHIPTLKNAMIKIELSLLFGHHVLHLQTFCQKPVIY